MRSSARERCCIRVVDNVKAAGGELIVMPHSDEDVARAAKTQGLACAPGVVTPNEAFLALKNGADVLKMFPAEQLGPVVTKAWRAVIAKEVPLVPVGRRHFPGQQHGALPHGGRERFRSRIGAVQAGAERGGDRASRAAVHRRTGRRPR